jgi:uronate dehydrogenase
MAMMRILLTGAAGEIGTFLRKLLKDRYELRLSDRTPIDTLAAGESFVPADLADLDAVRRAVRGVDGIVHLGAISSEDSWERILPANIIGTYNVFEAAREAGVKRVVFASSVHAVGFYPRDRRIGVDVTVRPDSRYGLAKCFGEAAGALYADKHGLEVLCIRIGNAWPKPVDERRLCIWISDRDLAQLVRIGLEHPGLHYEIVYGASANTRTFWDNSAAERLGYRPADNAEDYARELLANGPIEDPNDPSFRWQGGGLTTVP